MAAYKSAHGWFYTYYHAGHYLKKNGGAAGITKTLNETHIDNLKASIKR
jgi:hypothetical protein